MTGGPAPARPGRKLGPIAEDASPAHRAWLEPLRDAYQTSGMTFEQLGRSMGWSRSKISELLRAVGRYPRWECLRALLHALAMPGTSVVALRGLWVMAALEVNKRTLWIKGCVAQDFPNPDSERPVDLNAFQELYKETYFRYANTFLRSPTDAERAVADVFFLLRVVWDVALASANSEQFAWRVLRETVMERAPHRDGYPALVEAAFDSIALRQACDGDTELHQVEESMDLFREVRRLPPDQLDVVVLLYLRGMRDVDVARVLGLSIGLVRSTERHARRSLNDTLFPFPNRSTPEG
ncbi:MULTISPECIES: helix-turn-helix domain-containing protein [unclassified Streptomyces]|uniref:helix-turn-helix domain-containing protein n=1 Tax=unclassified Streptomyces TaxID=2593676 RepID=UPI0013700F19|nr:helix-turn-helix domain-containing protein [Streptomyces sp. SID335]MYZ13246.1 helix-turn-helix domain-containing protein [Streptomyces sp. SID337]NDZ88305.1 helix-turn-helix domain-containing protein [Streptomyces sp. SID10115]NEA02236.1 helix-turn-helix domain-containing protein [Streptomyces sp. SID10116]NEB49958.1 helix-turn-helix domain-containing protein [Streptomyces sp. SID339]